MGKASKLATAREEAMRGEVLHYDDEQGFGFINGVDGKRYAFERSDLRRLVPVGKGTVVEFQIDGATAREIFIIRSDTRPSAPASFGRDAVVAEPEGTGIWSYFIRTLTSNYANFRGRARRKEYWGYVLFMTILMVIAHRPRPGQQFRQPGRRGTLATMWRSVVHPGDIHPGIALTVRRQHTTSACPAGSICWCLCYVGSLIVSSSP